MLEEFRKISPQDYTKLNIIANMMNRDSVKYASQITDSISDFVARKVADALVCRTISPRIEVQNLVTELKSRNLMY